MEELPGSTKPAEVEADDEPDFVRLEFEVEPTIQPPKIAEMQALYEKMNIVLLQNMDAHARLSIILAGQEYPNNFITEMAKIQVTFLSSLRDGPDMLQKFAVAYNNFAGQKMQRWAEMRHTNTLH